ncbi:hypothetical protein VW23_001665 [Devosia insulae DS-56]|uniref:Uncharacterized protein n=1 Tax=Devosia insulae DS-56 TaxID=1116389 RepID=A0A1E5XMH6_9HYPH|nr:hypothetical protein [Devosia insulae]OEO29781.1 hypothetical protein VW23_001665 [Devosia insulae DS-56]
MGNPRHYSLELPDRCLALLDELWPAVADGRSGRGYGGPLTTTFLLSLATPMIVLPVERLLKQTGDEGFADDRLIDPDLAARAQRIFAEGVRFRDCDFFDDADGWRYHYHGQRLNLANGLPDEIVASLATEDAAQAAATVGAQTMVKALRNGLAHGVIAYLGADGRSTYREHAEMIALMGEHRVDRKFVGLHVIRIPEAGLRAFLHRWVDWLNRTGLSRALAA